MKKQVIAASVRYGKEKNRYNGMISPDEWQKQAWMMYDITGQGRFVANSVANTASRASLYIAEIDPDSGEIIGEADDPGLQPYAASPLGTGQRRRENLRTSILNLFVAGDIYLVGEQTDQGDLWYLVSSFDLQSSRMSKGVYECTRPEYLGGGETKLDDGRDIISRIWTPHPQRNAWPDSPFRAALPDLSILSTIRKREGAELDSRLAAGLFLIPEEVEFPDGVDEFQQKLINALAEPVNNHATPESLTPIVTQVASDYIEKFRWINFWSELSSELGDLEERKIKGVGQSLDAPITMLEGTGSESRWNAWLTSEETITTHYDPILSRIADGITNVYLAPQLHLAGLDSTRYTYAFDTAPIRARVDKLGDSIQLYDRYLVSGDTVRTEANLSEDAAPSQEEITRRIVRELIQTNPTLITPDMLSAAGLSLIGELPATTDEPDTVLQPEPDIPDDTGNTPVQEPTPGPPPTTVEEPTQSVRYAHTTSGCDHPMHQIHDLAHAATLRALEIAGGRLVPHRPRGTKRATLHTQLPDPPDPHSVTKALHGAWLTLSETIGEEPSAALEPILDGYTRSLIAARLPHTKPRLCALLSALSEEQSHG